MLLSASCAIRTFDKMTCAKTDQAGKYVYVHRFVYKEDVEQSDSDENAWGGKVLQLKN